MSWDNMPKVYKFSVILVVMSIATVIVQRDLIIAGILVAIALVTSLGYSLISKSQNNRDKD